MKTMDSDQKASTTQALDAITRQLHDHWFEVAEVESDPTAGTVTIPFLARNQPRPGPAWVDRVLCIGSVRRLRLEDSEHIGKYDFNELRYAPETGVLRVTTGVPLTLEVTVGTLDVAVRPLGTGAG